MRVLIYHAIVYMYFQYFVFRASITLKNYYYLRSLILIFFFQELYSEKFYNVSFFINSKKRETNRNYDNTEIFSVWKQGS